MARVWATPQGAEPAPSCSRSCCKHDNEPAKSKVPTSDPALPLPPGKCPCSDRQTTQPDGPKAIGCDLSLPTALVIDLGLPCPDIAVFGSAVFPSDLSLHLLHRVWLC